MTTTEKVYADGYGRWHVIVKDSAYGLQHAIYAIASELQERSAHGTDPVDVLHYVNDNNILYQDDFTNPATGWAVAEFGSYFIGYHEPESYHVEIQSAHLPAPVVSIPDAEPGYIHFAEYSILGN